MKRFLALSLAVILFASALASCAAAPKAAVSPNVRLTSSDATDAAAWLTARLGDAITDRIVLGTEADGHGIALDALEADGYVIRALGDEVALFAHTAEGLDRAVRKYAKTVEAGETIADVTYHEGYRIEELRLANVPVGEYAIAVEGDDDYIRNWVTKNAAAPFAELVKIACGAKIAVGGDAKHKIIFRQIADVNFKESSYHYYFANGDLIFEYADLGGARNAAVKFLENECGWDDLYYGIDVLHEEDLIDVPSDVDVLCHPRFGGIRLTTSSQLYPYSTLYSVSPSAFTYKYRVESAHHYLGRIWGAEYGVAKTGHIPCLTDENVLETVVEEITENIEGRLSSGTVIGEDLTAINLGAADTNDWCACKECIKAAKEENFSWAGPLVRFANAVEEALDEAGYDGLKFPIFAYAGSNPPPKTSPNDDIYVTYVCDKYCTHHSIDGSQCSGSCLEVSSVLGGKLGGNNNETAKWIKGWCAIAKHVYVRPAPLSAPFHAYTIIDQLYDEITFLTECGVECIYNEIYTTDELDTNLIATELWEAMLFAPDMTRTEYYEEAAWLFEKYYGDGWQGAFDYIECLERTELDAEGCWSAWHGYAFISDAIQNDHATYRELWDRMLDSLAAAQRGASSAKEEDRIKRLRISALYGGCYASYYLAYEQGDVDRIAMLCGRWDEMIALCKEVGIYASFDTMVKDKLLQYEAGSKLIYDSLEDTAWIGGWAIGWYNDREEIMSREGYDAKDLKPAPERYAP